VNQVRPDAYQVLEATSRTFFLPIQRLPGELREAVASAYLALRAIDEIEDHRKLDAALRSKLLQEVARAIEAAGPAHDVPDFSAVFALARSAAHPLPDVTLRLAEWLELAPPRVRMRIADSTSAMARRMADWVERDFHVADEADLDRYTFAVAGAVGLLLAELWQWWDGTDSDRTLAVGFGRGLQAVNIVRNREEDLDEGVDFHPPGCSPLQMIEYARRQLSHADRYVASLPPGPIREFCAIPLGLAHGSLAVIVEGRAKLTRPEVEAIVARCVEESAPVNPA
jgi:farnesyl-diphosphate farnesyltransferase